MKIVAFIPARGGSKSIPLKNIKSFKGQPLIHWAIQAAQQCTNIDKIYVSTDSGQIIDIVNKYSNVNIHYRSAESATDTAPTEVCMFDFAQQHMFDKMVLIQATSPFITHQDLNEGIKLSYKYDSVLSVVEAKRFIWTTKNKIGIPVNYNPQNRPRRQEMPAQYIENGAFYITTRNGLLQTECRLSGTIGLYVMQQHTYFELDEPQDWLLMEKLHD